VTLRQETTAKEVASDRQPLGSCSRCLLEETKEITMNKNSSTALGLILAVALTTGSVLAEHPSTIGKKAPGAYSDIMIAADETKRESPAGEKAAVPTDVPQSGGESKKVTGTNPPPDQVNPPR
jgi:hypothetical protein